MKITELILADLFENISKDELIKNLQKKRESRYLDMILKKMHELIQTNGGRQSVGGSAFDISRMLGGAISGRELERLYKQKYTNESQINIQHKIFEDNNIIDNQKGWGAVPNNQEVDYLGLRVKMSPKTFINLAAPLDREPSEDIIKHIKNGGQIGSPFLIIEIPESWEDGDLSIPARVVGHEGRNRMLAITKTMGNNPIEVHLFFSQGLRNRHITDEFKKTLNKGLIKEKSKSIIKGPLFSLTESVLEWGRIVKGVNTTADVDTDEIKTQAAKFGNTVDKDGRPPSMSKKTKGSKTNVLYNLGLVKEDAHPKYTAYEWALIEGGHTFEDSVVKPKKPKQAGDLFTQLENFANKKKETDLLEKTLLSEAMKDYIKFGTLKFQEPNPKNKVDGIILGSKHYGDRETQKLLANEQREIGRMFGKFVRDPVSKQVTSVDVEDGMSFCLYNDDNLGVALTKKEFKFDNIDDYFVGYLVTTVSQGLFPYSDQQLFRVPNDPSEPCRLFNEQDKESLTPSQKKALGKQGRFAK